MKKAESLVVPAAIAARRRETSAAVLQLAFIVIQGPIALFIPKHSTLATYHALLTFGFGMFAAMFLRRPVVVACACAYITGAAVFWRMRAAPALPWEAGKYAIIAILGAAVLFSVRVSRPGLPVLYFALLLPSVPLTISAVPWEEARASLSFNLSGPLCLTMSVLFFSAIRLSRTQMRWVAVSLLAPIFGIAMVAAQNLQQALEDPGFEFAGGSSNAVSSGGFGPNQVSAALGLGMVAILVYLILRPALKIVTATMMAMMLFLARQCLITLSRGGMYMAVGATLAAAAFLLQDPALRRRFLLGAVVIGAVLFFLVIPRLELMTGGFLGSRFQDTGGTGREELIRGDFDSFAESPIVGLGPGMGGANRLKYFYVPTAHTEYTRLFAEHGIIGGLALVVIIAIGLRAVRSQISREGRAISAALLAYAALFMAVDATRLAAPAFAVGLASAILLPRLRRTRLTHSDSAYSMPASPPSLTAQLPSRAS